MQKKRFHQLCQKTMFSSQDIQSFRQLFQETGTLTDTRAMITQGIDSAIQYLSTLKSSESRDILESLAIKIRDRVM